MGERNEPAFALIVRGSSIPSIMLGTSEWKRRTNALGGVMRAARSAQQLSDIARLDEGMAQAEHGNVHIQSS